MYNGNEASFSKSDRKKVLSTLKVLGVDHREKSDTQEILVNSDSLGDIQDLVAQIYNQNSSASRSAIR